ncbi:serine/threonine-protein kinase [Actinoplanes octamycinicus]
MGEVWAATDTVLGRPVAVKTLLGGRGTDPGFLSRFRHEARTMAALRHPGVVPVYDFGDTEDGAFLVMARVAGQPLNQMLAERGQLTVAETMSVVAQAGRALQAAHEAGVVHRDVKPGNLIIEPDGTVVLVDFGVARSANSVTLTGAREVVGTALYIAPEQVSKRATGPAADIYALGAVAYNCLAGRPPFLGDNPLAVALQHVTDEPAPLSRDVPRPVRDLVGIALAKDPAERFPSAAAMASAAEFAAADAAARSNAMATGLSTNTEAIGLDAATFGSLANSGALAAGGAMAAGAAVAGSPTSSGATATGGTATSAGAAGSPTSSGSMATGGAATSAGATGNSASSGAMAAGGAAAGAGFAGSPDSAAPGISDAATEAVPAGAGSVFAARAMVGGPRYADILPVGPARDGNTMAAELPESFTRVDTPPATGADGPAKSTRPDGPATDGSAAARAAAGIAAAGAAGGTATGGAAGGTATGETAGGIARSGAAGAIAPGRVAGSNAALQDTGGIATGHRAGGIATGHRADGVAAGQRAGGLATGGAGGASIGGAGGRGRDRDLADGRRKKGLIAAMVGLLLLAGLGAVLALADPFGMFDKEPAGGTAPAGGKPSAVVKTSPTPTSTGDKDDDDNSGPDRPTTRTSAPATAPTGKGTAEPTKPQPADPDPTTADPTTEPAEPTEEPTTAEPTETGTDGGDDSGTGGGDQDSGGNGGGNSDNSGPGNNNE